MSTASVTVRGEKRLRPLGSRGVGSRLLRAMLAPGLVSLTPASPSGLCQSRMNGSLSLSETIWPLLLCTAALYL
jgi:hypothetical protein